MEQQRSHRIETFDPLLRDMAAWGLVECDPSAPGDGWRLSAEAQRRLDELVQPAEVVAAEHLVYLDHVCAGCRQRGLTRLRQGEYLCEPCSAARAAAAGADGAAAGTEPRSSRRGRLRRASGEGTNPLAG